MMKWVSFSKYGYCIFDKYTKELSQTDQKMKLVWIFPRKSSSSRDDWKVYRKKALEKTQSLEAWRKEFQVERVVDIPRLSKNYSNPFPRLVSVPVNGVTARISVKGRDNEWDWFQGNNTQVTRELKEAEFPDFKIKKSSYNERTRIYEGWSLLFEVLDENANVIATLETNPIEIVSNPKQIIPLRIDKLVPSEGLIFKQHEVTIYGQFKYDTTMKVFFGGESKLFEWKMDGILLVFGVSSNVPQTVPVSIQTKNWTTNQLAFTFFNMSENYSQEKNSSSSYVVNNDSLQSQNSLESQSPAVVESLSTQTTEKDD